MGNRNLLDGAPTVEVDMDRYDELLRKEEKLNIVAKLIIKSNLVSFKTLETILEGVEVKHE